MLQSGQSFARFTIIEKIGEGGMGAVYLAEDSKLNRQVALKVLLQEAFDDETRQERFRREAKTAAQVSHGNVMAIYDIDSHTDEATGITYDFIVMEYIKGTSLTDYISEKKPSNNEIVRLCEKISAGLAAAHKLNIVHRDIKSDNILIDETGEPKILDFGLAKPVASYESDDSTKTVDSGLTQAGKIIGTVSYMSPEQAKGETVDTRSDIFSFGILLYRMITGDFPFTGPTQVSTIAKILDSQYEAPRSKNKSIPFELERIIDKCLQKDSNDRYQNTQDLVIDLRNLRKRFDSGVTDTISAEIPAFPQPKKQYVFRLNKIQMIMVAIFIVIVSTAAWKYFSGSEKGIAQAVQAQENALAILSFENKTGDASLNWLETALPEILLTDLAQADIIKVISRERVIDCLPEDKRLNHTFDECVDAANHLGAVYVLSGTFIKLGDQIRINANIEETATSNILYGLKVVGVDTLALIDSLTQKIADALGIREAFGEDKSVATFVSSPKAYQHYQAGMKYFLEELYDDAIASFNMAIAEDSTFAMPYMRIGMSYMFDGKQKIGTQYFGLAKERENNLPNRERMLLDIYADLWLTPNYSDAFVKMESFVNTYPDDKEALTIYGLLVSVFQQDVQAALVFIDSALKIDPSFQFALSQAATIYRNEQEYDKAIEYTEKIKKLHPNSPDAYLQLATIYRRTGKYDKAMDEIKELIELQPDNKDARLRYASYPILLEDFTAADKYIKEYRSIITGDDYELVNYYNLQATLALWDGDTKEFIDNHHQCLKHALRTNDSAIIKLRYSILGHYYRQFGMYDSAYFYYQQSYPYRTTFQDFDYYFNIVSVKPELADSIRTEFKEVITEFRARIPSNLWPIADNIEKVFEAFAASDTSAMLHSLLELRKSQNQTQGQQETAKLQVQQGQYEAGKTVLMNFVEGENRSTNAYTFLTSHYYIGYAEEMLGNTSKAIEHYKVVTVYWPDPDMIIEEARNAHKRLAQLTG